MKLLSLVILLLWNMGCFAASTLTISSAAAPQFGKLPAIYSCDGKSINPDVSWTGVDPKAAAYVVVFSDPDAPGGTYYHWVLYNIPKATTSLPEGMTTLPAGTLVGKNSKGSDGYTPPCPPKGSNHHYIFTIFSLNAPLALSNGADVNAIVNAMQNHVLQMGQYTTTFGH